MQALTISVVIPTFNSGHLVTEAVASVLGQTIVPAEIIVVDDGSTDDTPDRLAPFAGRIRYVRQENQGVSTARNRGVEEARGEFVAFLDADDVWHPKKIELQLAAFDLAPHLGLLGTTHVAWPAECWPVVPSAPPKPVLVSWKRLTVKNWFTMSSVVVRRSILDSLGGFDPGLQGSADHDFWLRIAEVAEVANIHLPLTGYRSVVGSMSKQAIEMEADMHRILRKLDSRHLWEGRRILRRKAYSYFRHSCAYMYSESGSHRTALLRSIQSFLLYPFPYRRDEVRTTFERPKRSLMNVLRILRLK